MEIDQARPAVASRLLLGTVQLGVPYGRRAGGEVLGDTEADAVLDAAWELGVRAFDTAEGYGVAAGRLADWLRRRGVAGSVEVVTKVALGTRQPEPGEVERAVGRFADAGRVILLTHGAVGPEAWERLVELARGLGCGLGQSVYEPGEVRAAQRLPRVERIQLPGNVFDPRALDAAHEGPVPCDVRSVYLQGLLLDAPGTAERRVPGGGTLAEAVARAAADAGEPAEALLLAAVLRRLRAADRLAVGAEAPEQVGVWRLAGELDPRAVERFTGILGTLASRPVEDRLLDPRRW